MLVVVAYLIEQKVTSKLLVFSNEVINMVVLEVLGLRCIEAIELIREDGRKFGLVPHIRRTHIIKFDLVPTLGLWDLDLRKLAMEIMAYYVCIKLTVKTRDQLTLMD